MSEERRQQLEEIDPSWCPAWPVEWQRAFHLSRLHLEEGGALPTEPGDVVRQDEDLGRWVKAVRFGWHKLTAVQQWMCEQVLGIEPAAEDEKPKPRRTQADKWAMNFAAARQFYEREEHLRVPRKRVERIGVGDSEDQEERELRLGGMDREPAEQGRHALTRARRTALRHRHEMDVEGTRPGRLSERGPAAALRCGAPGMANEPPSAISSLFH
ncbi:hypothetical protein [Streptomyces sp. NPDC127197]|uniref:hypothetical protein n=1 Tax=Streptomyces sp. NPDC127197 TaxID=3345388 RepID=UPI00363C353B